MTLKCTYSSITTPKSGNSIDENEDNFLVPGKSEVESDMVLRFAVADGATESSFSKEWSDLLVSSYKNSPFDKGHFAETIRLVAKTWQAKATANVLPWYAEQKAETGAFATFLGLTINLEESVFDAVAIGDCTLFHVSHDESVCTFPISSIEEFGNTPNLIASNEIYQSDFDKTVIYLNGSIKANDLFLLATDALAAWIFKDIAACGKPWSLLLGILENEKDDFDTWLNNQRQASQIKNDDVTLIIIKFE